MLQKLLHRIGGDKVGWGEAWGLHVHAGRAVRAGREVMRPDSRAQQLHGRWRNRVLQCGGMDVLGRVGTVSAGVGSMLIVAGLFGAGAPV
eukprot:11439350-Prorocentrum_lima.AAC.1